MDRIKLNDDPPLVSWNSNHGSFAEDRMQDPLSQGIVYPGGRYIVSFCFSDLFQCPLLQIRIQGHCVFHIFLLRIE